MADTDLVLTGIGITPYSARGLRESLAPIAARWVQKYAVSIAGSDQEPPAFEAIWPGELRRTVNGTLIDLSGVAVEVTVDCLSKLAYPSMTGSPSRTIVPGSDYVEGGFTIYRPRLVCLVRDLSIDRDEWNAAIGWSLDLEEV